jgi:excinuclease ABC subunit B
MEGARTDSDAEKSGRGKGKSKISVAEPRIDYAALDPETLAAKIKKLEAQMYKHAQDLDFEAAAKVRDELKRVKAQGLVS